MQRISAARSIVSPLLRSLHPVVMRRFLNVGATINNAATWAVAFVMTASLAVTQMAGARVIVRQTP